MPPVYIYLHLDLVSSHVSTYVRKFTDRNKHFPFDLYFFHLLTLKIVVKKSVDRDISQQNWNEETRFPKPFSKIEFPLITSGRGYWTTTSCWKLPIIWEVRKAGAGAGGAGQGRIDIGITAEVTLLQFSAFATWKKNFMDSVKIESFKLCSMVFGWIIWVPLKEYEDNFSWKLVRLPEI